MAYAIKEIYATLQGEGFHTGRAAVFLRFSGCNLWSGREEDRDQAVCRFCDTDFFGTDGPMGGRYETASELAACVDRVWRDRNTRPTGNGDPDRRFVVCTGGEPLLQLDRALVEALKVHAFEIAVETNGTVNPPEGLDWICVSPKADAPIVLTRGDELKLVFRQDGAEPEAYAGLDFDHFYLQPMDGTSVEEHTASAIDYCLKYPQWKLSLQVHKLLGIP